MSDALIKIGLILGSHRPSGNNGGMHSWLLRTLSPSLLSSPNIALVELDYTNPPLGPFLDPTVPWQQPTSQSSSYSSPIIQSWSKRVAECDSYIALFPQHNYSFPGELKTAFDQLFWEWTGKGIFLIEYSPRDDGRGRKQLKESLEGGVGMRVVQEMGVKLPYSCVTGSGSVGGLKEEELGWLEGRNEELREKFGRLVKDAKERRKAKAAEVLKVEP